MSLFKSVLGFGIAGACLFALIGGLQGRGVSDTTPDNGGGQPLRIRGKILCIDCALEDVVADYPDGNPLYEVATSRQTLVVRVNRVNDSPNRRHFLWPPRIQLQADHELEQQLLTPANRLKDIELTGALNTGGLFAAESLRLIR